jgi:Protein of unknown function (DUF3606)
MARPSVRNSPLERGLLENGMEQRIDVQNEGQLRYWCEELHASEEELRRAVEHVGPDVDKVREHLVGGFTSGGPTS